jgi:hypothetical protein
MVIKGLVGAWVGALVGVLALAVAGAAEGYAHGWNAAPPGAGAACLGGLVAVAYFWWLAGALGAGIGELAGLGGGVAGALLRRGRGSSGGPPQPVPSSGRR